MDILQRALEVRLSRLLPAGGVDSETHASVLSRQLLRFQLTIAFSNQNGERYRDGAALMALMGESDFPLMWKKLFRTIRVAPVLVDSLASGPSEVMNEAGHSEEESCTFSFGAGGCGSLLSCVKCPAGKIFTLTEVENVPPVTTETKKSSLLLSSLLGSGNVGGSLVCGSVPKYMRSVYEFNHTLPDLDEFGGSVTLGYVLFFPLSYGSRAWKDEMSKVRDGVAQAFFPWAAWSHTQLTPTLLGTCYYRVEMRRVLECSSVARRAAPYRVLVNVNTLNVSDVPVCVCQASFDLYSTWTGNSLGSLSTVPLWSEQRAGPSGADLQAVELLRRVVSVTPVAVHGFRVPVTLRPGESVGFQFALQVRPHLCHHFLLGPPTLRELYGGSFLCSPRNKDVAKNGEEKPTSPGCATAVSVGSGGCDTLSAGICASDSDELTREELLQVLFLNFTSHVYLYYEVSGTPPSGLHLRHPVHWSMLAPL